MSVLGETYYNQYLAPGERDSNSPNPYNQQSSQPPKRKFREEKEEDIPENVVGYQVCTSYYFVPKFLIWLFKAVSKLYFLMLLLTCLLWFANNINVVILLINTYKHTSIHFPPCLSIVEETKAAFRLNLTINVRGVPLNERIMLYLLNSSV